MYAALLAGSERGQTYRDNQAAFAELGFAPHVAGQPAERDLTTTVMGQEISLPVIISPTGVQAVHPEGEVAVARAAAARGTRDGAEQLRLQVRWRRSCRPTRGRSSRCTGPAAGT